MNRESDNKNHSHSNHFFGVFIIFLYHFDVGMLNVSFFSETYFFVSFYIAVTTYLAALTPDWIAPSINPWDSVAIYVPAQWIFPSGALKSSIFVNTPGGKNAIGAPLIDFYSFHTFQWIDTGLSILSDLK